MVQLMSRGPRPLILRDGGAGGASDEAVYDLVTIPAFRWINSFSLFSPLYLRRCLFLLSARPTYPVLFGG